MFRHSRGCICFVKTRFIVTRKVISSSIEIITLHANVLTLLLRHPKIAFWGRFLHFHDHLNSFLMMLKLQLSSNLSQFRIIFISRLSQIQDFCNAAKPDTYLIVFENRSKIFHFKTIKRAKCCQGFLDTVQEIQFS